MNTSKQVNAMVVVLLLTVIMIGVYTLFDPFRADKAEDDQLEMTGVRAATTFALNCRLCHGDRGEGGAAGGRLPAALALDREDLRGIENGVFSVAAFNEAFRMIEGTISCGRPGTFMPTWGRVNGGILSAEQIRQLAVLITGGDIGADPLQQGGFWEQAEEHAVEIDAATVGHATLQMPSGTLSATATEVVVSNAAPFSVDQYIRIDEERMQIVDIPTTGRVLIREIGREPGQILVSSADGIAVGDVIRLDGELVEVTAIGDAGDAGIEIDADVGQFANVISVSRPSFFSPGYVMRAGDELIEVKGPIDTGQILSAGFGRADTTISISGSLGVEEGMVIRLDDELIRVLSLQPATVTLDRGVADADGNPTQVASHPAGASILKVVEEPEEGEVPEDPDTGQTVLITLDSNETVMTVSGVFGLSEGNTFQIDDELVTVTAARPAVLRVERAVGGTDNGIHGRGSSVFVGNLLEVERGFLGTSAAAQSAGTDVFFAELDIDRAQGGSVLAAHTKNAEIFIGGSIFVERGSLDTDAEEHANGTLVLDFPPPPEGVATTAAACGQRPIVLPATDGPVATPRPDAEQVAVSLTEFAVEAVPAQAAGTAFDFNVSNDGAILHDFRVFATDLAPDALPVDGAVVDESSLDLVAEGGIFAAGDSRVASADLEPGSYVLICNVPGHYGAGMFTAFEVLAP